MTLDSPTRAHDVEVLDADPGLSGPAPSSVAWIPDHELEYLAWATAGQRLGMVGRSCQWWLGDWMRYGSARWGEKYAKAAAITGYDVQSLRNMAYVAARFDDVSRRRDTLSWSHHAEVAALEPHEQDSWLGRAVAERLSVAGLRFALRETRAHAQVTPDEEEGEEESEGSPAVVCPRCGHAFSLEGAQAA